MPTRAPYIRDLIVKNYIHPDPRDTDDLDRTLRAIDAELRGIAVRQRVFFLWLDEHWTSQGTPAAGAAFRLDAYIRALAARHDLTRQPGEDDAEFAHRALAAEVVAETTRCQLLDDWTESAANHTRRTRRVGDKARSSRRRREDRRRPSGHRALAEPGPAPQGPDPGAADDAG